MVWLNCKDKLNFEKQKEIISEKTHQVWILDLIKLIPYATAKDVKFYLLYNNFIREFFFEKIKKYMEEECQSYMFMYNLLMWGKSCSSYPLETVYI